MSVLNAIGEFAGGASQGVGQGMDLYARYQDIQTKNSERSKKEALEKKAIELSQDPQFKDDPIGISSGLADAALELGDIASYDTFTKAATSARDLKAQKLGMSAWAKSRVNPEAAVGDINEMFKVYGNNNNIAVQRTPSGTRLNFNVDGKNYTTDYAEGDTEKFQFDMMRLMEGYVMKPDDAGKLEVEREKGSAYSSNLKSETATREALLPSQIGENVAQTRSALAAADASGARATEIRTKLPGELEAQATDIGYKKALTAATLDPPAPKTAALTAEGIIDKLVKSNDELGLGGSGLASDKMFLGDMQDALREATPGLDEQTAAYQAYELASIPPEQLNQPGSVEKAIEEGKRTGKMTLPNGATVAYNPRIMRLIGRIAAGAAPGEE